MEGGGLSLLSWREISEERTLAYLLSFFRERAPREYVVERSDDDADLVERISCGCPDICAHRLYWVALVCF